jgi:hypothetical protein
VGDLGRAHPITGQHDERLSPLLPISHQTCQTATSLSPRARFPEEDLQFGRGVPPSLNEANRPRRSPPRHSSPSRHSPPTTSYGPRHGDYILAMLLSSETTQSSSISIVKLWCGTARPHHDAHLAASGSGLADPGRRVAGRLRDRIGLRVACFGRLMRRQLGSIAAGGPSFNSAIV